MRIKTVRRIGYAGQWDRTVKRGDQIATLVPLILEQARLGKGELAGRLPTSQAGADYSNDPPPHYADPTGEAAVNGRRAPEYDDVEAALAFLDALDDAAHAVDRLDQAIRTLLGRVPAMRDAITAGSSPRDGRARLEREQAEYVHVHDDQPCMISEDHDEDEAFGPGQLRRGMCNRHRMAFARWAKQQAPAGESVFDADLVVRWRAESWPEAWAAGEPAEEPAASPYKNLKQVA